MRETDTSALYDDPTSTEPFHITVPTNAPRGAPVCMHSTRRDGFYWCGKPATVNARGEPRCAEHGT